MENGYIHRMEGELDLVASERDHDRSRTWTVILGRSHFAQDVKFDFFNP